MPITPFYGNVGLSCLLLNTTTGIASSGVYLALFSGDPSESLTNELAFDDYSRHSVTFITPLSGETRNNADVAFGTIGADWGSITHWGLFDASTNGHLLFYDAFDEAVSPLAGDSVTVAAGTLVLSLE